MIAGRGGGTVLAGAMRPASPAAAPAAHQVFLKAISRSAVKAPPVAKPPPGVEPGVSGKELRFQQSRRFGPGPISPTKGVRESWGGSPVLTMLRGLSEAARAAPQRGRLRQPPSPDSFPDVFNAGYRSNYQAPLEQWEQQRAAQAREEALEAPASTPRFDMSNARPGSHVSELPSSPRVAGLDELKRVLASLGAA